MFVDGYSIKKASGFRKFFQTANDVVRGEAGKKSESWKKVVTVNKISDL